LPTLASEAGRLANGASRGCPRQRIRATGVGERTAQYIALRQLREPERPWRAYAAQHVWAAA